MSCYSPIIAWDTGIPNVETGKRKIKILGLKADDNLEKLKDKYGKDLLLLPCGKCIGCVQDYKMSWAVRLLLESQLHDKNCFITLTYSDACLPSDNKPHKDEIQRFIKRLRKITGEQFKVFYCGEKGEKSGRAHYHAIIFGYDFPDRAVFGRTAKGSIIYTSEILRKAWPFGNSSVGDVEPGSACYVAQYSMKKKLNNFDDGSFVGMSRRPGIGFNKFNLRWFKSDTIYCALGEATIPRFFQKLYEGLDPDAFDAWKNKRLARVVPSSKRFYYGLGNEEEALQYMETVKLLQLSSRGVL